MAQRFSAAIETIKRLHAPHGRPTPMGDHSSPRTYAFLSKQRVSTSATPNMILGGTAPLALPTDDFSGSALLAMPTDDCWVAQRLMIFGWRSAFSAATEQVKILARPAWAPQNDR